MSKKSEGKSHPKSGVQKPALSMKRNGNQKKSPADEKKQQRADSGNRKKRQKNQLRLNGNTDYGDPFNSADSIDSGAEDILRKPRRESALHYSKPLPPAKEPDSPGKRRLLRFLFYGLTLLIVLTIGVVLSFTVFFKIEEISVEGSTRYNEENIIASSMIHTGENFFLCNTSPGEAEIWKKFPYIEDVHIEKKLFNKIVINIREATPTSVIESEGSYVLLSESGKIIDISDKQQNDVPMIMGAKLDEPTLSSSVVFKDKNVEEYLQQILRAAEEYRIGELKVIDISKLSNITLETAGGLHIILGSPDHIDYKLMTARKIMKKDVPEGDVGTLDVSLSASENGKSYFRSQKRIEQSSEESSQKQKESSAEGQSNTSGETSSDSSAEESQETTESFADDGGYDDGGYDNGGYDNGGYDDGGYDNGGYDDGGYDNGGYDNGGSGYDDGGYDNGGYDNGGNDDGGNDDGGYDDGGNDDGGYDDGGYDNGGYDNGGYDNSGNEAGNE